jgi:predicted RNA-binding protein with RPS1 domain
VQSLERKWNFKAHIDDCDEESLSVKRAEEEKKAAQKRKDARKAGTVMQVIESNDRIRQRIEKRDLHTCALQGRMQGRGRMQGGE